MSLRDGQGPPRYLAAAAGAICLFAAVVLASLVFPIQSWLRVLGEALAQAGVPGAAAIIFASVLLAAAGFPTSLLTLMAGLLYGPWALPVAWVTGVALAAISFQGARRLFGESSRQALSRRPRLDRIAQVANDEGWRIVFLVRASGLVPFAIQNYAFGCLTRIPLVPFILATAAGIVPGVVLTGLMGVAARSAATADADYYRVVALLIAALAAFALVALAARRLAPYLRSGAERG